jgi:hypothetical protein
MEEKGINKKGNGEDGCSPEEPTLLAAHFSHARRVAVQSAILSSLQRLSY